MTPGRWSICHFFLLAYISSLAFENAEGSGDGDRSTAKVSTIMAHAVCTERAEFEKTGVLQKPVKRKSDFDLGAVKCGWLALQPSGQSFYPCDGEGQGTSQGSSQGQGGSSHQGRGINVQRPWQTNQTVNQTELEDFGLDYMKRDAQGFYSEFLKKNSGDKQGRLNGKTGAKPLPLSIAPQHYDIFLRPVLYDGHKWPKFSAPGTVKILLDVIEPTTSISLHRGDRLKTSVVKLTLKSDNSEVPIVKESYEEAEEIQTYEVASPLTVGKGQYELFIEFTTNMETHLSGLFKIPYVDHFGTTKILAVTQMEFDRARYAFPVFEDNHFKATFSMSAARIASDNSRSNSPLSKTIEDPENPGWFIDSFEKSPKMSAYLVALIVSDHICKAADSSLYPKIPIQMCCEKHYIENGDLDFALNLSAKALKLVEDTLKYPYEHSKLDQAVALYLYGGMENWGMIFYKEDGLIFVPRFTSESKIITAATTVIHEVVHHWVGNLVTCKNWNHTWIQEGLTTYVTATLLPQLHPEIRPHNFVEEIRHTLKTDGADGTPVGGPTATEEPIIYIKGAAILRMVEAFMGKQLLMEAIVEFIKRFAYSSVEQDDLFTVLNELAQKEGKLGSDQTIKNILEPWVMQPGRPLVRVEAGSTEGQIKLSQEVYVKKGESTNSSVLWSIPIYVSSDTNQSINGKTPDLWFSTATQETTLANVELGSAILVNAEAFGYYHVLYSDDLFSRIVSQLSKDHKIISPAAKATLIHDYFYLYDGGHVPLESALKLTSHLLDEADQDVWLTFFRSFPTSISSRLWADPEFRNFWIPRLEKMLDMYGVEDRPEDSGSVVQMKALLFEWSSLIVVPAFTSKASALIQQWNSTGGKSPIRFDYWTAIYCGAVADKDASQFDFLLQVHETTPDVEVSQVEWSSLQRGLMCGQTPELIKKCIDFAKNTRRILDSYHFYQDFTTRFPARGELLKLFKGWLEKGSDDRPDGFTSLLLIDFAALTRTEAERDELLKLVEDYKKRIADPDRVIEGINNNSIQWLESTGKPALKWFSDCTSSKC